MFIESQRTYIISFLQPFIEVTKWTNLPKGFNQKNFIVFPLRGQERSNLPFLEPSFPLISSLLSETMFCNPKSVILIYFILNL